MIRFYVFLVFMLSSMASMAGPFSYSQAILNYSDSEFDSLDGSGVDASLTYDLNRVLLSLHVQKIDYDLPSTEELYTEYHSLGAGTYFTLDEITDVYGLLMLGKFDAGVNPAGAKLASSDSLEFRLGLRRWLSDVFEGQLYAGVIDFDSGIDNQSYFGARLIFYVSGEHTMGLSFAYEIYDDFDHALLGAVISF